MKTIWIFASAFCLLSSCASPLRRPSSSPRLERQSNSLIALNEDCPEFKKTVENLIIYAKPPLPDRPLPYSMENISFSPIASGVGCRATFEKYPFGDVRASTLASWAQLIAADRIRSAKNADGRIILIAEECTLIHEQVPYLLRLTRLLDKISPSENLVTYSKIFGRCHADATAVLPRFLRETASELPCSRGPNCWNTALTLHGITSGIRHVTPHELKQYLASPLCQEIHAETAEPGDLVVWRHYDLTTVGQLNKTRFRDGIFEDHAFVYISPVLAFEKPDPIRAWELLDRHFNPPPEMMNWNRLPASYYGIPPEQSEPGRNGWINFFRCSRNFASLRRENEVTLGTHKSHQSFLHTEAALAQLETKLNQEASASIGSPNCSPANPINPDQKEFYRKNFLGIKQKAKLELDGIVRDSNPMVYFFWENLMFRADSGLEHIREASKTIEMP